jgi:hypothetical protein
MKKLLFVAVLAVATYPALACDWNREASAKDPVIATTTVTTEQAPQATPSVAASTSVASEQSVRRPVDEATTIVSIRNRQ